MREHIADFLWDWSDLLRVVGVFITFIAGILMVGVLFGPYIAGTLAVGVITWFAGVVGDEL